MKNLLYALLTILALILTVRAGNTGNPYIYTFAGDPTSAATASLNPPKGALIYDTTNNVWRLKTSALGSNAGYDILITGTAASTLVNAVLTTPAITGGIATSSTLAAVVLSGTITGNYTRTGIVTGGTLSVPVISATTGTTSGSLGTSGTNLFFYNGTAWRQLDN